MTDRLQLDGANFALSPVTDLGMSLGGAARRYSAIHGDNVAASTASNQRDQGGRGAGRGIAGQRDRPRLGDRPGQCDEGADGRARPGGGVSVGLFGLADASIAQVALKDGVKKTPPKRTATALSDRTAVPEPR